VDSITVSPNVVSNRTKHQPAKISFQLSTLPTLHPQINYIIPNCGVVQDITKTHIMLLNSTTKRTHTHTQKKKIDLYPQCHTDKTQISPHPYIANLKALILPVAKASLITSQVAKACFGVERENQIKSHHSTWLCLIRPNSNSKCNYLTLIIRVIFL
jgi:hypothetical protein